MAAKGIVKMQPIVNAISCANCLSSCGPREVFAVSTGSTGRMVYAGMHLLSTVDGVEWTMSVQSATACAFASPTSRFTFTSQTCSGAQIATPIALPAASTECLYWRGNCVPASTTDFRLGLIWVGIQ